MRVIFTVEDDALPAPIASTAVVETIAAKDIADAYRYLDPAAYDEIDTGQKDEDGKPVKVKLTDEQIIRKIAGNHMQAVLDNVDRAADMKAEAAKAARQKTTFQVA
jgi:hypothetical protein